MQPGKEATYPCSGDPGIMTFQRRTRNESDVRFDSLCDDLDGGIVYGTAMEGPYFWKS